MREERTTTSANSMSWVFLQRRVVCRASDQHGQLRGRKGHIAVFSGERALVVRIKPTHLDAGWEVHVKFDCAVTAINSPVQRFDRSTSLQGEQRGVQEEAEMAQSDRGAE